MLQGFYKTKEKLFNIALRYLKEKCNKGSEIIWVNDIKSSTSKDYETEIIYGNEYYSNHTQYVSTHDFEEFINKHWTR